MTALLDELTAVYTQDCDQSNDIQELKLSTGDNGGGRYLVIETKRWAIDSIDELVATLNDFKLKAEIK